MARSERRERPVSEAEYEEFPEGIRGHFDRVRSALEDALSEDED